MAPQVVLVYAGPTGTFGTQFAPPGTGVVASKAVIAGRFAPGSVAVPTRVRDWLISAAAAAELPFRYCPSASRRLSSDLVKNTMLPFRAEPASPEVFHG